MGDGTPQSIEQVELWEAAEETGGGGENNQLKPMLPQLFQAVSRALKWDA